MSHTKGPWTYEMYENFVVYGQNDEICELREGDQEANARLIAAAPDLLDACKYLIENCFDNSNDDGYNDCEWIEQVYIAMEHAQKALRKVEGRVK
jgi:hypothetical protein